MEALVKRSFKARPRKVNTPSIQITLSNSNNPNTCIIEDPNHQLTCQGRVKKTGRQGIHFKLRWLVLIGDELRYYQNFSSKEESGIISLSANSIVLVKETKEQEFQFTVQSGPKERVKSTTHILNQP